jgi:YrbI family 3-deoxy-D-manno-octulosonate 8-phosphate phosphatase
MVEVLALIPARGGSKSIPRKNIRLFAGHPLVAYSIAAGLQASRVTRTIVSTDDEEIAEVARKYGAETPFLRPAEFAQDNTTDLPVFQHALGWLQEHEGYQPDIVVQLRPTSPIRPTDCVDAAVQLLLDHSEADSVRGIVPSGQNPFKMWRVDEQGRMAPLLSVPGIAEPYNAPRQALPQTYWQTGHIDAIRVSTIYQKHSLSGDIIYSLMIDPRYTVDIDTLRDWQRAEWLVAQGDLDMVLPGPAKRPLPDKVELVVFDFDGVMTDDRVWVDQEGHEMVAANRRDGLGIAMLLKASIPAVVISTEPNPVVAARCRKLGLPVMQGIGDKAAALRQLLAERQVQPEHVVYLGNDVNDLPCFPLVGCAVVTADANPEVGRQADLVLSHKGGYGAVRELCERLIK